MKKTTIIAAMAMVIALAAPIMQAEEHETPGAATVTNQPSPWGIQR
jgi:invasion protein IalB